MFLSDRSSPCANKLQQQYLSKGCPMQRSRIDCLCSGIQSASQWGQAQQRNASRNHLLHGNRCAWTKRGGSNFKRNFNTSCYFALAVFITSECIWSWRRKGRVTITKQARNTTALQLSLTHEGTKTWKNTRVPEDAWKPIVPGTRWCFWTWRYLSLLVTLLYSYDYN